MTEQTPEPQAPDTHAPGDEAQAPGVVSDPSLGEPGDAEPSPGPEEDSDPEVDEEDDTDDGAPEEVDETEADDQTAEQG